MMFRLQIKAKVGMPAGVGRGGGGAGGTLLGGVGLHPWPRHTQHLLVLPEVVFQ